MNKLFLFCLAILTFSCSKNQESSTISTSLVKLTPATGHFKDQEISLEQLIRYEKEEAYFEGQKDALTEIIRIEKIDGCDEGWRWTRSPWDGTNRQPIFIPPLCKNP